MSGIHRAQPGHAEPREIDWVPVDRRLLGLDSRTLVPAAAVAVLVAVAVWLLPAVDRSLSYDDPVRAGDIVQLRDDVQFVPAAGANLLDGLRQGRPGPGGTYPDAATLSYDGLSFSVTADDYDGTPAELLRQIKRNNDRYRTDARLAVTSDPIAITNDAGDHGVAAHFDGANAKGLVAAFVFGGTGVQIVVLGPNAVDGRAAPAVADMIQSVRPVREGS
ncbi:hypothetical protein [Polymorphospora rubra]|uniref:Uncharacterized protein n=1 Tax=Polymorphospora rubra TaxID=338584 RepID=A0A810NAT4_9ACTN|nr:hypothetical protein [Polymorphospora rubra]BCJ68455.1 hypothetical protein Prubr_54760 [Polymorphospora rubra]